MRLLLNAIRTATGPVGLWSEPAEQGFRTVLGPLPRAHPAVAAWAALTEPGTPMVAFLRFVLQTLPGEAVQSATPRVPPTPAAPRATAAHPRAWRGTHRQPPKPPRPALDLRALALDPRGYRILQDSLGVDLPEGLEKELSGERVARLQGAWTVDPGIAARFGPVEVPLALLQELGRDDLDPRELLRFWWGLGLPADDALRAAAARLVHVASHPGRALEWLGLALACSPQVREELLVRAVREGRWDRPAPPAEDLEEDFELTMGAWSRGVPRAWVRLGLELGPFGRYPPDWADALPEEPPVTAEQVRGAVEPYPRGLWSPYRSLLQALQKNPVAARMLRELPWTLLGPRVRTRLLDLICFDESLPEELADDVLPWLEPWLSSADDEESLRRLAALGELLEEASSTAELRAQWTRARQMLMDLVAERLPAAGHLAAVLLRLPNPPAVPSPPYRRATRRENDRWLVLRGLESLAEFAPARLADELPRAGRAFFRTCRSLGCLSPPRAARVLASPKGLDVALAEELNRRIGLDPTEERAGHALRMLASIEWNRRALREALRAYARGDRDWAERHPCSERWFRAHPRVPRELWRTGLRRCEVLPDGRQVTLEVETDLLEVLRMGTLVGSCLGLGGSYSHSAVAAALDVNKRVVFARDERGRLLGRQLLALSEEGRLVCHPVHPARTPRGLRLAFARYDAEFARALAVPPDTGEKDADVALVLAEACYQDWAWDKIIPSFRGMQRELGGLRPGPHARA